MQPRAVPRPRTSTPLPTALPPPFAGCRGRPPGLSHLRLVLPASAVARGRTASVTVNEKEPVASITAPCAQQARRGRVPSGTGRAAGEDVGT